MTNRINRLLLAAFAIFALPVAVTAQQASNATAPNQQQLQTWVTELQQLNGKLEEIQAKAMQDPKLQAEQEALGAQVKATMEKLDPTLPASIERMQVLEDEAMKAQQSGNQAKLQELAQEAQQIQVRFMNAQAQAFQQPELSAKLQAFQTQLERRMVSVDPQAETLIKRFRDLETKLSAAMQQGS